MFVIALLTWIGLLAEGDFLGWAGFLWRLCSRGGRSPPLSLVCLLFLPLVGSVGLASLGRFGFSVVVVCPPLGWSWWRSLALWFVVCCGWVVLKHFTDQWVLYRRHSPHKST